MNLLDLYIFVVLLATGAWGALSGLARQLGSAVGLWLGLFIGSLLAPHTVSHVSSAGSRLWIAALTVGLPVVFFGAIGGILGRRASTRLDATRLVPVDRALGAVVSVVATLLSIWIVVTSVADAPVGALARQIQQSAIIGLLDRHLPPVPSVTARLGRLVNPLGFPRVFAGLEPGPADPVPAPSSAEVASAVTAAKRSTVKIEGDGCGGLVDGSGYVAAADLVVTNAHVVAGTGRVTVIDATGRHRAVLVLIDPKVDLAVLRVTGLAGPPLALVDQEAAIGARGAVLGYPGGGPFDVQPAAVRAAYPAVGRDIYGQHLVTRNVDELQALVRPGNSGGPFVLADGRVAAIVFARSVTANDVGYALSASEVRPRLAAATRLTAAVASGACAA